MLLVSKKKIGGNHAFSEIIKPQFGKERHSLLCILKLFTNIVDSQLSSKNAWFPVMFFLDCNNTCQDLLFPHIQ